MLLVEDLGDAPAAAAQVPHTYGDLLLPVRFTCSCRFADTHVHVNMQAQFAKQSAIGHWCRANPAKCYRTLVHAQLLDSGSLLIGKVFRPLTDWLLAGLQAAGAAEIDRGAAGAGGAGAGADCMQQTLPGNTAAASLPESLAEVKDSTGVDTPEVRHLQPCQ